MTDNTSGIWTAYGRHRYGILFYSLLLSLAILPILPLIRAVTIDRNVVEIFLALNLIAAVFAVGEGMLRRVGLVVLFVALATRLGSAWFGQSALLTGSLAAWGVIALLAAASALVYALRGQAVVAEKVYAALSVYLLAGLFFGLLYWAIDQAAPASLAVAAGPESISTSTAIYFSFVTLASLGYGDVLPLSDPARGLAVIEVVGGQLYLAVMVARLVSAWR